MLCTVLSCLCLGCINDEAQRVPVIDGWLQTPARNDEYRVKQGDTLYSIAWDFGLDYRDLAAANGLTPPYALVSGQMLKMTSQNGNIMTHQAQNTHSYAYAYRSSATLPANEMQTLATSAYSSYQIRQIKQMPSSQQQQNQKHGIPILHAAAMPPISTSNHTTTALQLSKNAKPQQKLPIGVPFAAHIAHWLWPTQGKIIQNYSTEPVGNHGIDISGVLGQPILATSAGEVVYSGTGVRGYGNLIIIKHNSNYLSAYAYNKTLLVKLGQRVQAGQEIATMGRGDAGRIMLHFEIRFNGQPVNPIILLR